jgi:hypothetical protein
MKNPFIKVRFDRMKNEELIVLYQQIINLLKMYDAEQFDLSMAFKRFCQQKEELKNLERKQRKLPQTANIVSLRKQNDKLVSAMLLHLKALKYAAFDDQMVEIQISYDWTRKLFKNFAHEGQRSKNAKLNILLKAINQKEAIHDAFEKLGIIRYVTEIVKINQLIADNNKKNNAVKQLRPAVGVSIPTKVLVIDELRLLLRTIEITAITHPDIDYHPLVREINQLLTEARTQLRNLATRRKTAVAKATDLDETGVEINNKVE